MKVFLSHQHGDKPVVEPIAIALKDKLGEANVFYDSWSIKPGEGIIDKMNEGMTAPDFVFFFVSENSLASGMVKLEWHNALYKAAKGQTKLIPVRVDGADMPALLLQSVYIDMHNVGIAAAQNQIVQIVTGDDTYTPQHAEFSNLTASVAKLNDKHYEVTISASHLSEHSPQILLAVRNASGDASVWVKGCGGVSPQEFGLNAVNGTIIGVGAKPMTGDVIKPKFPRVLELRSQKAPLDLVAVLLETDPGQFRMLPTVGL